MSKLIVDSDGSFTGSWSDASAFDAHDNKSNQSSIKQANPEMVNMIERFNTLQSSSVTDFLSGVRKIGTELTAKRAALEVDLTVMEEILPNTLDCLKSHKKELLDLRSEMESLRDTYISHVATVLDTFKLHAPAIVSQMESLSIKESQLNRLKCDEKGEELIASCVLAMETHDFQSLNKNYRDAVQHEQNMLECDLNSSTSYAEKIVELSKTMTLYTDGKITILLNSIRYPFEDTIDYRSLNKETDVLVNLLYLWYAIAERLEPTSGIKSVTDRLFSPLSVRFHFHFSGDRKTNDISKPEWYFAQALSWLSTTLPFYELVLSKFSKISAARLAASASFHSSISDLVIRKTEGILTEEKVISNDKLFSHIIDECVTYEEQRIELDPLNEGRNIMNIFCQDNLLSRWRKIEEVSCIAFIDEILTSEEKWHSRFRQMDDADPYLVCECAESFVSLLHSLQMRVKLLGDESAQGYLMSLQKILLDDFRTRLTQISRQAESPWSEPYPQVMNAIWYLCHVIEEWNESGLWGLSGSGHAIFEQLGDMYRMIWTEMANEMVNALGLQSLHSAKQYQQQRWSGGLSLSLSYSSREISSHFCPFLMKVRSIFANTSSIISPASLPSLLKKMTTTVAIILQTEAVDVTSFNSEGATQMLFDIEHGLLPILSNIYQRSKVENLNASYDKAMTCLLGSIRLLSLSWAVASLLKDEINKVPDEIAEQKLSDMGIRGVDKERALRLFSLRNDRLNDGNSIQLR